MAWTPRAPAVALALLPTVALAGCGNAGAVGPPIPPAIHRIRHVIVVMQENRSFDNYFGTYPGADGIPRAVMEGKADCNVEPGTSSCLLPYHDTRQVDVGGPHTAENAMADMDNGRMDGFVREVRHALIHPCLRDPTMPGCVVDATRPDVMGYHTAAEIPNYWRYAQDFVLQDHMFASNLGWSLPSHLAMVSGWSASCASNIDPLSCHSFDGWTRGRPQGVFHRGRLPERRADRSDDGRQAGFTAGRARERARARRPVQGVRLQPSAAEAGALATHTESGLSIRSG